jgi:hypothetical protein
MNPIGAFLNAVVLGAIACVRKGSGNTNIPTGRPTTPPRTHQQVAPVWQPAPPTPMPAKRRGPEASELGDL